MKFTIILKNEDDSSTPLIVSEIEPTGPLTAATLGLTLADSKHLLARIQQELVETQLQCHFAHQRIGEKGPIANPITVLTDGDPGLRDLLMSALPKATHLLDWFHRTRRLTVMKRVLHGKDAIKQFPSHYHDRLCRHLVSLKWRLWHGYIGGAINRILALLLTLRLSLIAGTRAAVRLRRLIKELLRYFKNNIDSLANYGWRYRHGQRISTAFMESALMESALNQLIDKRMSKSQQMRWSPIGAHRLLQVRAELVDGRLGDTSDRWYPGFTSGNNQLYQVAE